MIDANGRGIPPKRLKTGDIPKQHGKRQAGAAPVAAKEAFSRRTGSDSPLPHKNNKKVTTHGKSK